VLIRPKIGIPQLLSLACYAMGVFKSQDKRMFDFDEERALPDTLALALAAAARRAFSRGLLHGYRTEEEALHTVRGRIRFADQIRQRFGIPLPIEVRYDEFTDDITENQLVKAAAIRLGGMRPRSQDARRNLGWIAAMLENVSSVESFPKDVPDVRFDRINEHYRGVVGLSRLILRHSAFESERGVVHATRKRYP
jgi:5-methylcytosine-specific restriction enzyme subunit McrC